MHSQKNHFFKAEFAINFERSSQKFQSLEGHPGPMFNSDKCGLET